MKLFEKFVFPLFGTDVVRLNENFKKLNEFLSSQAGDSDITVNINGKKFNTANERLLSIEKALQDMGYDLPGKDVIK